VRAHIVICCRPIIKDKRFVLWVARGRVRSSKRYSAYYVVQHKLPRCVAEEEIEVNKDVAHVRVLQKVERIVQRASTKGRRKLVYVFM
jgi:hypothetical protein